MTWEWMIVISIGLICVTVVISEYLQYKIKKR